MRFGFHYRGRRKRDRGGRAPVLEISVPRERLMVERLCECRGVSVRF